MARYSDAVDWIAFNDGAGDTPDDMTYNQAYAEIQGQVTILMVADIFCKDSQYVMHDVLKARGFKKPSTWKTTGDYNG